MQINENRFKIILMQINENRFISLYTYQSKVTFWYGYCLVDETYLVEIVKYIFFTFFLLFKASESVHSDFSRFYKNYKVPKENQHHGSKLLLTVVIYNCRHA